MKKILLLTLLIISGWYSFGLSSLLQTEQEKHLPFLRLRLRSSVRSDAQIFFDIGRGIQPNDVVTRGVSAGDGWIDYEFPLPSAPVAFFRFDPLMTNGEMTVQSAAVMDYKHQVLRNLPLQNFIPLNQIQSLQITPAGLLIVTQNPAPDPQIGIRLDHALDLSSQGQQTIASWGRVIGWHALTLLLVLGITRALVALLRHQRWGGPLDFSLLPGNGLERFPLELYLYLASAAVVLLVEISGLEQAVFRLL